MKVPLEGKLTWDSLPGIFDYNKVSVRRSALLVSDEIWSSLVFESDHPGFDPTSKTEMLVGDLGTFCGVPIFTEATSKEKFVIKPDEFWVVPQQNVRDLKESFTREDFEEKLLQIDETKIIAGTVFNHT